MMGYKYITKKIISDIDLIISEIKNNICGLINDTIIHNILYRHSCEYVIEKALNRILQFRFYNKKNILLYLCTSALFFELDIFDKCKVTYFNSFILIAYICHKHNRNLMEVYLNNVKNILHIDTLTIDDIPTVYKMNDKLAVNEFIKTFDSLDSFMYEAIYFRFIYEINTKYTNCYRNYFKLYITVVVLFITNTEYIQNSYYKRYSDTDYIESTLQTLQLTILSCMCNYTFHYKNILSILMQLRENITCHINNIELDIIKSNKLLFIS